MIKETQAKWAAMEKSKKRLLVWLTVFVGIVIVGFCTERFGLQCLGAGAILGMHVGRD